MHPPAIAPEHSDCLLRIIEAAAQVRRRYQYFLWTQADMQRLLPHKLAVCGVYDRARRDLVFETLHSVPVPPEALAVLAEPRSLLTQRLALSWIDGRQEPTLVDLQPWRLADPAAATLADAGFARLLVHGVSRPGRPAELETLFIFGSPDCPPGDGAACALGLLLPYLHATYLRVHAMESGLGGPLAAPGLVPRAGRSSASGAAITEREREILRWVREGLSNQQIADALQISALTVKNHVQKILRKLGASNRAQAVAKAMALNLLGSEPPQVTPTAVHTSLPPLPEPPLHEVRPA
ncbi:MAG: LuxR C-terminal-related transcriptional regulator [Pseudomonadota bacterium]